MERLLKYYYDLTIEKINIYNDKMYFFYNGYTYNIVKCEREISNVNELYSLNMYLLKNGIYYDEIILNRNNEFISDGYVLLKLNHPLSKDIDLNDLINNTYIINDNNILKRDNWALLWENKIDYFEYQISELGYDKNIILNSFSYYIGLSENAISIVNNMNNKYPKYKKNYVIQHKRIKYPYLEVDYYNPLNVIIDIQVRDIAEYIKDNFFYGNNINIYRYLDKLIIDDYLANMFFARLLYPSYYFDLYEKIIENNIEESELLVIINKVDEYQLFLKEIWIYLNSKYKMEKVEWIIKKES